MRVPDIVLRDVEASAKKTGPIWTNLEILSSTFINAKLCARVRN